VPFGILHHLSVVVEEADQEHPAGPVAPPPYQRKLGRGAFAPAAPAGPNGTMTLDTRNPLEVVFRGERLAVGFSLIRPMLTRLDWNHFGDRTPTGNRLFFKGSFGSGDTLGGQNGPCAGYLSHPPGFLIVKQAEVVTKMEYHAALS
jgi:hypothetical protein